MNKPSLTKINPKVSAVPKLHLETIYEKSSQLLHTQRPKHSWSMMGTTATLSTRDTEVTGQSQNMGLFRQDADGATGTCSKDYSWVQLTERSNRHFDQAKMLDTLRKGSDLKNKRLDQFKLEQDKLTEGQKRIIAKRLKPITIEIFIDVERGTKELIILSDETVELTVDTFLLRNKVRMPKIRDRLINYARKLFQKENNIKPVPAPRLSERHRRFHSSVSKEMIGDVTRGSPEETSKERQNLHQQQPVLQTEQTPRMDSPSCLSQTSDKSDRLRSLGLFKQSLLEFKRELTLKKMSDVAASARKRVNPANEHRGRKVVQTEVSPVSQVPRSFLSPQIPRRSKPFSPVCSPSPSRREMYETNSYLANYLRKKEYEAKRGRIV